MIISGIFNDLLRQITLADLRSRNKNTIRLFLKADQEICLLYNAYICVIVEGTK